ncbi:hypothetical protein X760_23725 [Mesorhizobium sp. LSHC422A00]|nr:hypothetical protein X767_29760 [Mesorhizobium sp. LSJC264A00]ESX42549.1 hypothetical protein X762_29390 [Mesorhizobium sp. LSHC426A00]ESX57051.1 hypothetical protein X760_23725 [Mesorhizobium sp. LSHC422A00]
MARKRLTTRSSAFAALRLKASLFAGNAGAWIITTFRPVASSSAPLAGAQFSVTRARSSPWRKLSFVDLLAAICLFVNGAKGMSAVQFSRDLDVQYKTAFVLAHKLREACRLKPRTKPLKARSRLTALTLVAWCAPRARASATARTPLESIFSSSLA